MKIKKFELIILEQFKNETRTFDSKIFWNVLESGIIFIKELNENLNFMKTLENTFIQGHIGIWNLLEHNGNWK